MSGAPFDDGRSAVLAAAEAALALNALNGQRDGVTFNVGAIDGGGAVNVVPERAVLRFNVRAPDAEARPGPKREVQRIAREAGARDGIARICTAASRARPSRSTRTSRP